MLLMKQQKLKIMSQTNPTKFLPSHIKKRVSYVIINFLILNRTFIDYGLLEAQLLSNYIDVKDSPPHGTLADTAKNPLFVDRFGSSLWFAI